MDEPFSALDVLTAESLRSEVYGLWTRGNARAAQHAAHHPPDRGGRLPRRSHRHHGREPGRTIREVVTNPLPHPREYRDPAFLALVDGSTQRSPQIHLPDAPAAEPRPPSPAGGSRAAAPRQVKRSSACSRSPGSGRPHRPVRARVATAPGVRPRHSGRQGGRAARSRRDPEAGSHDHAARPPVQRQRRKRPQAHLPSASCRRFRPSCPCREPAHTRPRMRLPADVVQEELAIHVPHEPTQDPVRAIVTVGPLRRADRIRPGGRRGVLGRESTAAPAAAAR